MTTATRGDRATARRVVRGLVVVAVLAAGLLAPRALRAQGAEPRRATIALLPFAAEKRLALFGQPVASELTRALREAGLDVTLVSDGAPVPSRARLVVSGRIVKQGAGVVLESRIRDPERGRDVARPSSTAAAVEDIDQAAAALAAALLPAIRAGLAAQDLATARERAALAPAPPRSPPVARHPIRPRAAPPLDRRPLALVTVSATGLRDGAGAPVPVATLAAPAVAELAARVGHRAIAVAVDPTPAPALLAARGAALLINVELLGLAVETARDISLGRARARVTVTDAAGATIYRRIVRTDTLVGSRGDRMDTLVRLAAAQVTDVIAPRLRERLGLPVAP